MHGKLTAPVEAMDVWEFLSDVLFQSNDQMALVVCKSNVTFAVHAKMSVTEGDLHIIDVCDNHLLFWQTLYLKHGIFTL
jgi:hypothetical protein